MCSLDVDLTPEDVAEDAKEIKARLTRIRKALDLAAKIGAAQEDEPKK